MAVQDVLDTKAEAEALNVRNWRFDWLRRGGFSRTNADLIATSEIDKDYAIKLLNDAKAKGYDEAFVMGFLF